jgi:hypothetical protein
LCFDPSRSAAQVIVTALDAGELSTCKSS